MRFLTCISLLAASLPFAAGTGALRAQAPLYGHKVRTYTDPKFGVSFSYPDDWRSGPAIDHFFSGNTVLPEEGHPRMAAGRVTTNPQNGVEFEYAVLPEPDRTTCLRRATKLSQAESDRSPDEITIGNLHYAHVSTGDGPSGHQYLYDVYIAFQNGACYAFEADVYEDHLDSNTGKPIPEAGQMLAQLRAVAQSVRIDGQADLDGSALQAPLYADSRCLPRGEFAPALISNSENNVTFECASATPLDFIRAIGFQTRIPIGIVLGADLDALTKTHRSYSLQNADLQTSLSAAIDGTGYVIHDEGGIKVLVAGDLASRQYDLLHQTYSGFGRTGANRMVCWGITLTIAMRQAAHPTSGFAVSCSTSTNDENFALNLPPSATTEQIANAIVSKGSHGVWLLKLPASSTAQNPTEEIEVLSYQHYSNRPVTQR